MRKRRWSPTPSTDSHRTAAWGTVIWQLRSSFWPSLSSMNTCRASTLAPKLAPRSTMLSPPWQLSESAPEAVMEAMEGAAKAPAVSWLHMP